jgi:MshEN domain
MGAPPILEFVEVVKRSLAAKDVRILDEGEAPPTSGQTLACELPTGQVLAVMFEERPANPDSARRRLEMLVRAFASTLSAAGEPHHTLSKAHALHHELAALVGRAGALDAVVIDANSPAIWGGATLELPEIIEDEPTREPDNVIRIDRQSPSARRSELIDRSRELGIRAFEALAIDPRAMMLIPREICDEHRFVPLFGVGAGLLLAMADPTDLAGVHRAVLTTGLEVEPCLANERLIRFVLAWNHAGEKHPHGDVLGPLDPETMSQRETLAKNVCDRWARHFAIRRAIQVVRSMQEMSLLHKGGHLNRTITEPSFALIARSFAAIYVLVVVFPGPFDEIRAKHAISQALPIIEQLVLALPPRDPPPSISGAKAMRSPTRT